MVVAGAIYFLQSGDDELPIASPTSTTADIATTIPTSTAPAQAEPAAAQPGEVFLEPIGTAPPDAFSKPMATKPETPVAVALPELPLSPGSAGELASVKGTEPGLYGGTRDSAICDPAALVAFLEANAVKAAAWATVFGIDSEGIGDYVATLTPLTLTRDTRVTNHGFRDGAARPLQSVLQAGTAVLVDEFGVPRVKCYCGNPLLPPQPLNAVPTYTGTSWTTFDPAIPVVVVADAESALGLVLVDLDGGSPFVRNPGWPPVDGDAAVDTLCALYPADPACSAVEPDLLFEVNTLGGVDNLPTAPTTALFDAPVTLSSIRTYHWNFGQGASPGTIGLQGEDGTLYGPWPVTRTLEGQGGVPGAYWEVDVDLALPAGSYEVIDSDPATWAQNAETGGRGVTWIWGFSTAPGASDQ